MGSLVSSTGHKKEYSATIWFPLGVYIPSTNYLYKPGIRKKRFPYLYKHESVVEFQERVIALARETDLSLLRDVSFSQFDLSLVFLIRDRFWRRDVSNMIKATEDALVEIIGVDDSRVISITARKERQVCKEEGMEIIIRL